MLDANAESFNLSSLGELGGQMNLFNNDPTKNAIANMGINAGKEILASKMSWLFSFFQHRGLKYYFNVSNAYVINKIKLLLFPFLHKTWTRRRDDAYDGGQNAHDEFLPPKDDINAPDLYIPVMAFITYTLLSGYALGAKDKFTPEVLGMTASTCMVLLFLEVVMAKIAFYVIGTPSSPRIFDLIAYFTYKYCA